MYKFLSLHSLNVSEIYNFEYIYIYTYIYIHVLVYMYIFFVCIRRQRRLYIRLRSLCSLIRFNRASPFMSFLRAMLEYICIYTCMYVHIYIIYMCVHGMWRQWLKVLISIFIYYRECVTKKKKSDSFVK